MNKWDVSEVDRGAKVIRSSKHGRMRISGIKLSSCNTVLCRVNRTFLAFFKKKENLPLHCFWPILEHIYSNCRLVFAFFNCFPNIMPRRIDHRLLQAILGHEYPRVQRKYIQALQRLARIWRNGFRCRDNRPLSGNTEG